MDTKLFIKGKFIAGKGKEEPVLDPASGKLLANVHEASVEQIQKFAALFPKNARPIQQRNRRFVIDAS